MINSLKNWGRLTLTKIKKAAVILAVAFVAAVGAGVFIFHAVADITQTTLENSK